ncbi:MAG TPA: GNAT family protein [Planctomycetota bacterium]|nr:GNAT family protein [Planctomycetota bacterium]
MRTHLTGSKVRLRPLTHDDLPTRALWTADDERAVLMGVDVEAEPFVSHEDELRGNHEWLDGRVRAGGIVLAIEAGGRYVGDIDITTIQRERRAELSLFIGDRSAWGKGYGTETVELVLGELFAGEDVDAVDIDVAPGNERSLRFWRKLGFEEIPANAEEEGIRRLHRLRR